MASTSKYISVEDQFRYRTEDPIIHDTPDYTYHSTTISLPKPVQIVRSPSSEFNRGSSSSSPLVTIHPHKQVTFGENQVRMLSPTPNLTPAPTVIQSTTSATAPIYSTTNVTTRNFLAPSQPTLVSSTGPKVVSTNAPTSFTTASTSNSNLTSSNYTTAAPPTKPSIIVTNDQKPVEYKMDDQIVYDQTQKPYVLSTYYYLKRRNDQNYFVSSDNQSAQAVDGDNSTSKTLISSSNPNLIMSNVPEVRAQPQVTITRSSTTVMPVKPSIVKDGERVIKRYFHWPESQENISNSNAEIQKILKSSDAYSLKETIGKYDTGNVVISSSVSGTTQSPKSETKTIQTTVTNPVGVEIDKKPLLYKSDTPASIVLNREKEYTGSLRYHTSTPKSFQTRTLPLPTRRYNLYEPSRPNSLIVDSDRAPSPKTTTTTYERVISSRASDMSIPTKIAEVINESSSPTKAGQINVDKNAENTSLEINIEIEPQSNFKTTSIIINSSEPPQVQVDNNSANKNTTPKEYGILKSTPATDSKALVVPSRSESVVLGRTPYVTDFSAANTPAEEKEKDEIILAFEKKKDEPTPIVVEKESDDEEKDNDDSVSTVSTTPSKKSSRGKFKSALKKLNIFKKKK